MCIRDSLRNMPVNESRWESAHSSLLSTYRTNPISSRSVPRFVYDVNALGLNMDPRSSRFDKLGNLEISDFKRFYENKIQPRSILFSIVGDSSKIDMKSLEKLGRIERVEAKELFRR